ncbi:N-acetylneuraminate synthase family protein [Vicingaceae bacterium]|nr:N-acetylneuraminate synthase family protein [Vicingaceae bacterium]
MVSTIFLYSETAFHHEGDYSYLIRLIDDTKKSGLNAIKFQVILDLNYLTSSVHSGYQKLVKCVFTDEKWLKAFDYATNAGLDIIFLPLDLASFDLIISMKAKPKYLEIHPVCFYDTEIINRIKETRIPVILGVGGRTLKELNEVDDLLGVQLEVLLVGFQSFPSQIENVKLERIKVLKELYPNKTIGYADHSSFNDEFAIISNEYAYLLGARIFEKHITINEGEERIDFESAVSSRKLIKIKERLEFLDSKILNYSAEELLEISEPELTYRNRQKVYVAKRLLAEGQLVKNEDIVLKMINKVGGVIDKKEILGKKTITEIVKDDIITKNLLK